MESITIGNVEGSPGEVKQGILGSVLTCCYPMAWSNLTVFGLFIGSPSPLVSRKGEGIYALPRAQGLGLVLLDKAFWLRITVHPTNIWFFKGSCGSNNYRFVADTGR